MRELQPGLWHWDAPHPEWQGSVRWGQVVSSYAIDDGGRLLLFDPIAPPSGIVELATGRQTAIVLTCPWHERDARGLVERFGWPNGVVLWIENRRAVVVGDTLVDFGRGLQPPPADFGYGGLPRGVTRRQLAEGLRPLLDTQVELVLATHGGPTDGAALERALSGDR